MATPEKNTTGKPRPVPDDIAELQTEQGVSDYLDALDKATSPLDGAASRPDRESPKRPARRQRER